MMHTIRRLNSLNNDGDNMEQRRTSEKTSHRWVDIHHSTHPVDYDGACQHMDHCVEALKRGVGPEVLWFLQHPPLYTYGARTNPSHIAMAHHTGLPVHLSKRGGQLTYHGPGQRIVYCMIHLRHRGIGVTEYMDVLQQWIIRALSQCGIDGVVVPGFVGVWTAFGKVASIGVRVSGGISSHGLAINVREGREPDYPSRSRGFGAIIPCGLEKTSVVSLSDLDPGLSLQDIDTALLATNPFHDPGSVREMV
ncbi:MAG: lipoyl(octanoyl) transferase LipB [Alphaproteobacteria bacterium]|nr:lipoyl(octanoyl) transferase LipB [Alphaproteobacteria bacterium]